MANKPAAQNTQAPALEKKAVLDPNVTAAPAAVGKPPAFELVQNLDLIAGNMDIAYTNIQALLKAAEDEDVTPDCLRDYVVPAGVLERYVQFANQESLDLTQVDLIIADPDVDTTLKSINFHRLIQGLPATFIYLRFP